jgi:hypothetical protein
MEIPKKIRNIRVFSTISMTKINTCKRLHRNFLFIIQHIAGGSGKISETIEFPKTFTILGNLAVAGWIILDTLGLWVVNWAEGLIFLFAALIGIYGILKFLGCLRPCYNCKKCTFGLGRLAALYFGKRSLKDYKYNYHLPVAIFFYILLGPFPAAVLLLSTIQIFTVLKAAILIVLLLFSIYSALTWRPNRKP